MVDTETMLVVVADVTQAANDKEQVDPALEKLRALPAEVGSPEELLGDIKSMLGFRQFSLRGLENVRHEWTLVCLAWNLKRMAVL